MFPLFISWRFHKLFSIVSSAEYKIKANLHFLRENEFHIRRCMSWDGKEEVKYRTVCNEVRGSDGMKRWKSRDSTMRKRIFQPETLKLEDRGKNRSILLILLQVTERKTVREKDRESKGQEQKKGNKNWKRVKKRKPWTTLRNVSRPFLPFLLTVESQLPQNLFFVTEFLKYNGIELSVFY